MKMVKRLEKLEAKLVLPRDVIDDVVGLTHQLPDMQFVLMA
jgi:hypothetical protein